MKLHVALFFAGLFGALATLFILLSFGTDYWLLASETCNSHVNGPATLQVGGSVVSIPLGQREKWTSVLLIWIVLLVLVNYQKTRFRDGLFINMKQVSSELYILDFSVNWTRFLLFDPYWRSSSGHGHIWFISSDCHMTSSNVTIYSFSVAWV